MRSIPLRHRLAPVTATCSAVLVLASLIATNGAVVAHKKAVRSRGPVPCDAFKKNPNGSWTATRDATLTIGALHVNAGANTTYPLNAISLNGTDFAPYLDTHCTAGGKS